MESTSKFLYHIPCPSCGSSDANSLFDDGHEYCYACSRHASGSDAGGERKAAKKMPGELIQSLDYRELGVRGISEETCRKWGYGYAELYGDAVQVATYCDLNGTPVAQKIRTRDKQFSVLGNLKKAALYGAHLWRDGGRMIVVTEGEIDALSVSQIQDNKWPVVSIPSGANGAKSAIERNIEYLEKFEAVVFMFDNDEPGKKAALECAELLTPGKARIAALPLKDANDMLRAGRRKEVVDAMWGARVFRPDGILAREELWEHLTRVNNAKSVPYPYPGLNEMCHGLRESEVVTVTAGSGVGKSLLCREIAHSLVSSHGQKVGIIALEESVRRTVQGLLSITLNKLLHITDDTTNEQLRAAFDKTIGDKVFCYDHWGSIDSDTLLSKIRYMARGLGCRFVVLDHISIVVSGQEDGDERRCIDNLMTKLRSLAEETKLCIILVSHLKRPPGQGHEEGAVTSLAQLRGSAAIGQLSDIVIGAERNQQDPETRNILQLRVLKNRFTGQTGLADRLAYNVNTGRLEVAEFASDPAAGPTTDDSSDFEDKD